jgi:hypothetical protein
MSDTIAFLVRLTCLYLTRWRSYRHFVIATTFACCLSSHPKLSPAVPFVQPIFANGCRLRYLDWIGNSTSFIRDISSVLGSSIEVLTLGTSAIVDLSSDEFPMLTLPHLHTLAIAQTKPLVVLRAITTWFTPSLRTVHLSPSSRHHVQFILPFFQKNGAQLNTLSLPSHDTDLSLILPLCSSLLSLEIDRQAFDPINFTVDKLPTHFTLVKVSVFIDFSDGLKRRELNELDELMASTGRCFKYLMEMECSALKYMQLSGFLSDHFHLYEWGLRILANGFCGLVSGRRRVSILYLMMEQVCRFLLNFSPVQGQSKGRGD